jgi:enoyl-CoA hydratase
VKDVSRWTRLSCLGPRAIDVNSPHSFDRNRSIMIVETTEVLVTYQVEGPVGIVSLNRPDKLNAISSSLREQLSDALERADADGLTRVIVLRGEGRSFSAGFDLGADTDAWQHDALKWHEHLNTCLELQMLPWHMRKPVIASVQGHVLGGACELAMFCDITIAAENAIFGEPESRLSSAGPALIMPWIIGLKKARELLYVGDLIDAQTALQLGMINRVVLTSELGKASLAFAQRMALISPETLIAMKRAINRGAEAAGFDSAIHAGLDVLAPLYAARTEVGAEMQKMSSKEGFRAALRWRQAQFEDKK